MSVSESAFGGTLGNITNMKYSHLSPVDLIFKLEKEVQKAIKKIRNTQKYNQTIRD